MNCGGGGCANFGCARGAWLLGMVLAAMFEIALISTISGRSLRNCVSLAKSSKLLILSTSFDEPAPSNPACLSMMLKMSSMLSSEEVGLCAAGMLSDGFCGGASEDSGLARGLCCARFGIFFSAVWLLI